MRPSAHVAASAVISGVAYAATRSPVLSASALLSGIFLDVDHLVDFLLLSGEKLTITNAYSWHEEMRWNKIYLVLHSVEIVALVCLLAAWRRDALLAGLALGAGTHLALDQIFNPRLRPDCRMSAWFYFLAYRCRVGFRKARLVQWLDSRGD